MNASYFAKRSSRKSAALTPGLVLTAVVSAAAVLCESLEVAVTGRAWLEALVLAIVIGSLVRTFRTPVVICHPGIDFASKQLLELAVALMGATISFEAVTRAGPVLVGIILIVSAAIVFGTLIGRAVGLPIKMAMLVACGNAICGNSAIAAVAPVIEADSRDVASAIAFTAVLGVAVVLLLPAGAVLLGLGSTASGVLTGMTVYAVPQVIAAAGPLGPLAVQTGTLVKLIRVLMLGPVIAVLSLFVARRAWTGSVRQDGKSNTALVPWFIIAFLVLATINSLGLLPKFVNLFAEEAAALLTIFAMAGLGLGVDLRNVFAAGPRATVAVVLSLLFIIGATILLIRFIGIG